MDLQFYPTPLELARKAWAKFKTKDFKRVLEPSAGRGDLIKAMPNFDSYHRTVKVDVCEIDFEKHPNLRSISGVSVVGHDFMSFGGGAIYSHIIANPPFAYGVSHALKMWDCLYDGEIVVILNAESIKNPYSKERQLLVSYIERYGSVEFLESEFDTDETQRKTKVEVALVYLKKTSEVTSFVAGDIISDLEKENNKATAKSMSDEYSTYQELAIPNTSIENMVLVFQSAVKVMREAILTEAKANYYSNLIGKTMAEILSGTSNTSSTSVDWVRSEFEKRYIILKDKAWANVLRSSQITSKLSSAAQQRIESEFNTIKELEFSIANVEGFLRGLIENQTKIKLDMACDVFDTIVRYHTDNLVFYKGWKSNDNHRTCGMRIKTTRFVLPRNGFYSNSLDWDSKKRLSDFDKVFAMLDGKETPDTSLVYIFDNYFQQLKNGARLSSSYFDVRFYPGTGTIHFFPTDKDLIEKFNILVGQHRKWLPPSDVTASKSFWDQFKKAEKLDKQVRTAVYKYHNANGRKFWNNPISDLFQTGHNADSAVKANGIVDSIITEVLTSNGMPTEYYIENTEQLLIA